MSPSLFDVDTPALMFEPADGICVVEPYLVPGKASAHVTAINAYFATATLIQRCVGGIPSKGGRVRSFVEWRDIQSA